ncbi:MAG TPA: hypothetical protein VMX18_02335 [Candidatus Bipolaricaulota bacterium]|nr:hypothetical protein [Candidatus Bipolaricaulota bacterium]
MTPINQAAAADDNQRQDVNATENTDVNNEPAPKRGGLAYSEQKAAPSSAPAPDRAADELTMARRLKRRKMKDKVRRARSVAGGGAKLAGKGMKVAGKGMKVAGKGIKAGGQAVGATGSALSSTGIGAIVGVPLQIAGGAMSLGGSAVSAGGSGLGKLGKMASPGKARPEEPAQKVVKAAKKAISTFVKIFVPLVCCNPFCLLILLILFIVIMIAHQLGML